MGLYQQFRGKPRHQFTGIPHLDTIGKNDDLDKSWEVGFTYSFYGIPIPGSTNMGILDNMAVNSITAS